MDKRAMIAEIAARHSVRLDPDDPAFLLVELNQMVFEEKEAELKAHTEQAEKRLIELVGALQVAGDIYKGQITTYANAAGKEIQAALEQNYQVVKAQEEKDFLARKAQFDTASRDSIGEALNRAGRSFESTVQSEISRLQKQQPSREKMISIFLIGLLLGGFIVTAGNYWMVIKNQQEASAPGSAAVSVSTVKGQARNSNK